MSVNHEVRQLNTVVVDDDRGKQNRLRLALKAAGARVCWAVASPEELIGRVESNELDPEHIDAVFLDAVMQGEAQAGQRAMRYLVAQGLVRSDRISNLGNLDGIPNQVADSSRVVLVGSSMEPESSFGLGSYSLAMRGPLVVDWEYEKQQPLELSGLVLAIHILRGVTPPPQTAGVQS